MTPASSLNSGEPVAGTKPDNPRRRRRRWTAEQKADLLARFGTSGLTAAEFCRQAGLRPATISGWARRQRSTGGVSARLGFAEVQLKSAVPAVIPAESLLVQFGPDISLSVPPGIDAVWLGQLLRAART